MSYTLEELSPPTYELTDRGIRATRKQRLASWSDVDEYVDDLTRGVERVFPGRSALRLQTIRIKAFDDEKISGLDSRGLARCGSGALVELEYGTIDYQPDGGGNPDEPETWLSHNVEVQQQMMTHPNSALKWLSDDEPVPDDLLPGFPVTIVNHSLTWHNYVDPPFATWYDYVGKCNSVVFLGHKKEQVLFSGFGAARQVKTDGSTDYEIKMSFQARIVHKSGAGDIGWNHFLRDTGDWDRIVGQDGEKIVPTANFRNIFA